MSQSGDSDILLDSDAALKDLGEMELAMDPLDEDVGVPPNKRRCACLRSSWLPTTAIHAAWLVVVHTVLGLLLKLWVGVSWLQFGVIVGASAGVSLTALVLILLLHLIRCRRKGWTRLPNA